MPDDLDAPLDGSEHTETPPVADPAAAARAAADAQDASDDPEPKPDQFYVDPVTGHRFVRTEALSETRAKLKTIRKQTKELKDKAAKFDMVQPFLGLIATHPSLKGRMGLPDDPPAPQPEPARKLPPDPPPTVTDFDDVIESLGIDAAAGRKLATLVTHIADRRSARAVAPVAADAAKSTAQQARSRAYAATDDKGAAYATREAIDDVFSRIPDHMLNNDEVIKAALIQARGLGGPGKATEPLHTEDTGRRGGRGDTRKEPLTKMEENLAGQHNITADEWKELSRQDTLLLE